MTRRDLRGAGLRSSGLFQEDEDADPRVGLVNLADIMLVFSCGLMIALVAYWSLEIPEIVNADTENLLKVDDVQMIGDLLRDRDAAYSEVGTVYQDPETGDLYMMAADESLASKTTDASDGE